MLETIKGAFVWLLSLQPRDNVLTAEADRLRLSMRVTAKARYTASVRLKRTGTFAFITTTLLSLGLIFIPLMQNSGVTLALQPGVLNAMQIFLAVAVLVYSVMIGTSRYELRREQLNECGDKLKDLIREFNREKEAAGGTLSKQQLEHFHQRYSDITTDVENHTRNDYRLVMLEMSKDYNVTGIPRLWENLQAKVVQASAFAPGLSLLVVEAIFIADILGVTSVFPELLKVGVP